MDVRASLRARLFGCAVLLLCVGFAAAAFAQGAQSANLTGTVVDNVGVVPGATITITNPATGAVRTGVTDAQGQFRLVALPPGQYQLKINMEGFKQIDMAIPLQAGESRDLQKLTLAVGGRTETVNVTAEVTPVQTSSSALQKNLSSDLLTSVQVKGRDIFGMLKIMPGVVDNAASRDFTNWASGRSLSINGGSSLFKNTTIDGVPVGEEGGNGTTHITPNIDSVAEVNIISSGYTAENGRMAAGQVVMVTKSGTNEFKGSSWYNGRRTWMNKNDFFRIKQGNAKPFFAVDLYGFSIGGPVIIPKVINSRTSQKKVFFFGSTELTRDVRPTNVQYVNLPTSLERAGDFSQTFYCASAASNPCNRDASGTILRAGGQTRLLLANPFATSGVTDFFCAPGTGGLSGVGCSGTADNTGILNSKYFNAMGRSILNVLPNPNNQYNPAVGQAFTANNASDTLPEHVRSDIVTRVDVVLSQSTRFSVRGLFDRDDNTNFNNIVPGGGSAGNGGGSDNVFPGNLITGTVTKVIKPTVVNEVTVGFSQNHWGFKRRRGPLVASDYTDWYRGANNPMVNQILPDPPRLAPFGPYREPTQDNDNADQYPYFPYILFGGGNATNNGYISPGGSSGPQPRWNQNVRFTLSEDLSIVRGRHSFKMGFSAERNSKTEPGSQDYAGSYNFAHNGDNPLSTGNGYANAILGIFTSYTERDRRIDRENVHWLGEAYVQDTWRVNPRLTLDYGMRFTHTGSFYETRGYNSGFDPALYKASAVASLFTPYCLTGVAGNVACSSANRRALNPLTGAVVSQAFAGTVVPGSGTITNGSFTGGVPGLRPGEYDANKWMTYGPRVGFAWDVMGNGKTAIRGATGIFYNFPSCCPYPFNGGPQISVQRQVLNANISDIAEFQRTGNLAVNPQAAGFPRAYNPPIHGNAIVPGEYEASKHYQANFAVQRDIGFSTVVEVAWVGTYGRNYYQQKSANNVPINVYANPANLFNNEAKAADFLRRDYKGLGALNFVTSDTVGLNYNSLQVSVQRRLAQGLQMGLAYTLAKGESTSPGAWDFMTEELFGEQGLRDRYLGPRTASDQGLERRHVLVFHYSYQIPTLNLPIVKYILAGWEASGVTTMVTGDPINPSCGTGSGISGIANNDPSLTGVGSRCELVPGQSAFSGFDANPTGSAAFEDQLHFNPAAFQRPLPTNTSFTANGVLGPGALGNLGNAQWGMLRNPGWSNWDFALSRRLPIKVGRGGNVRLQMQFYNLFNQVEFNTMNAAFSFTSANATGGFGGGNTNSNTGKYTNVQNPFNFGVTIRFDY